MKYLISHYGAGYAVGLIQEEGAQEEINLAHNLFDATCHESIFHGTILFKSVKQFKRFLAYKAFAQGGTTAVKEFSRWKAAFKEAKRVMRENCKKENFMIQIMAQKKHYHNLGQYQDETDYEC